MALPTAARVSPPWFALGAAGSFAVAPSSAGAHVKWFCATADATQAPVPLPNVLTATFLVACGAFVLLVFAGLVADGYVARRWPALASTGARLAGVEEAVIRLVVAIYFLALWNGAAAVPWAAGEAVLTPELVPRSGVLGVLQLTIAILVVRRETCILATFGMCVLYANAALAYGVFHMHV